MKKFEYKYFNTNDGSDGSQESVEKYLCDLGEQGWEIIQVKFHEGMGTSSSILGVAKKEIP